MLVDDEQARTPAAIDHAGELHLLRGFDELVHDSRGQSGADADAFLRDLGPESVDEVAFPAPESPVRESGSPRRTQPAVARVLQNALEIPESPSA